LKTLPGFVRFLAFVVVGAHAPQFFSLGAIENVLGPHYPEGLSGDSLEA
jgi:hypothetical protein